MSRNTDPQTHARFPLTTIIVDEFTDKNIPVPPPHSWECSTVSHVAKIDFLKLVNMSYALSTI